MVLALLVVATAALCAVSVLVASDDYPLLRSGVTFVVLLVAPAAAFLLSSLVVQGTLPLAVAAVPLVLAGFGLYVVAEGRVPTWANVTTE